MNDPTPPAAPARRPAPFEILVVEDHPMMIRSIRAGLAALHADAHASDCIATVKDDRGRWVEHPQLEALRPLGPSSGLLYPAWRLKLQGRQEVHLMLRLDGYNLMRFPLFAVSDEAFVLTQGKLQLWIGLVLAVPLVVVLYVLTLIRVAADRSLPLFLAMAACEMLGAMWVSGVMHQLLPWVDRWQVGWLGWAGYVGLLGLSALHARVFLNTCEDDPVADGLLRAGAWLWLVVVPTIAILRPETSRLMLVMGGTVYAFAMVYLALRHAIKRAETHRLLFLAVWGVYELQEGDFQARRYTVVGAAEAHAAGVNVYTRASAQIDFSRINQTPTATDDSFTGFEDIRFSISGAQLLANDTDDGDPALANLGLRVTAVANASNGTASLDAQGNVSFVPWSNFYGAASFRYQVTDPEGASTWAKAFLNVQSVNDAPIIEDIWYGRPVYGYRRVDAYDGEGMWYAAYQLVTDASAAQAVLSGGGALYRASTAWMPDGDGGSSLITNYTAFSPTYYLNGQLRPIQIDTADASAISDYGGEIYFFIPVDDQYRQNGGIVAYDPDGNSSAITFSIGSSPQHGHAWANTYISAAYQPGVSHTYAGGYWVSSTGAWQYYSHFGDPYSGSDPFTVRVTDGQGASSLVSIGANHVGTGLSPIVIDLHHDGIELIRPEDSNVFMDLNGDGQRERIGWAAPGDAVLVFDANQDARVDFDHEVSFIDHLPGARTDLEGLAAHDSNGDGLITSADNRWTDFGLFQDRNANGVQDAGEFVSLDAAGLRSLSLTREGVSEMNQGNLVFGTSAVQWTDGSSTRAADVMFAAESLPLPQPMPLPDADLEADLDARVAHMVLLFNQIAALPDPSESHGLTVFVPAEQTSPIDDWVAATTAASLSSFVAMAT